MDEFISYWQIYARVNRQRQGQALFNAANHFSEATRKIAENVRGSINDPFHNDKAIDAFLALIAKEL